MRDCPQRGQSAVMQTDHTFIADTQTWLTRAVIGLQLCPFAKAVHLKNQIRYVVSHARQPQALLETLVQELQHLVQADPQVIETTLLIHPDVLTDFFDYNDFLDIADAALLELDLDGVLQIASFHPQYQFAGTDPDAIENHTNRSPYPTLHLLREASIESAMQNFEGADAIVDRNIATLQHLGLEGWRKLWV
jgi:uncharacterized protein